MTTRLDGRPKWRNWFPTYEVIVVESPWKSIGHLFYSEYESALMGPDGMSPFRFEDPYLLRANDEAARAAWIERFGEPMPPAGRPGRKPREKRTVRVHILFTELEKRMIDRERSDCSRSEFLRARALHRGSHVAPRFPLLELPEASGAHRGPA